MVETSSLRTLEIMPRNLNVSVCSWIPSLIRIWTSLHCSGMCCTAPEQSAPQGLSCPWSCLAAGARAAPRRVYTTGVWAESGRIYTTGVYAAPVLVYNTAACALTGRVYTPGAWAAPENVWPTGSCDGLDVSTPQRPELHLDPSTPA